VNEPEQEESNFDCCGWALIICSYILVVLTFPLTAFFCINVVQEYERAVILRLGRILPGL